MAESFKNVFPTALMQQGFQENIFKFPLKDRHKKTYHN